MNEVLDKISQFGILPVVVLEDAKDAFDVAQALCKGGLPCAEVTFRTKAAKESIEIMRKSFPNMLVGAGTVLTLKQVDDAIMAGAQFIVSPGFDEEIVKYCIEKKIVVIPGTCTPSDVQKCFRLGLDVVKFFPAEAAGGLKMIKAMAAPYPQIKFIPTGGVNVKNMVEYLTYDHVLAIGGSWMVKSGLIKNGEFAKIEDMTNEAVRILKEVR